MRYEWIKILLLASANIVLTLNIPLIRQIYRYYGIFKNTEIPVYLQHHWVVGSQHYICLRRQAIHIKIEDVKIDGSVDGNVQIGCDASIQLNRYSSSII